MNHSSAYMPGPVVAIDGGGTRCRLALRGRGADIVVELGSANVTTDFDAAISEISRGLELLSARAGIALDKLASLPAYVGLAGVAGPSVAEKVAEALPFSHIRVEDDRPSALVGALGARDGVVAHCGTGSFLAAQINKDQRFAGGWGPVLGDPASAQWVGRRGLTLALDAVDGLRGHSAYSQHVLDKLSGAAGIVQFASTARPADFGALAPAITAYAAEGDAIALQVVREAANSIAELLPILGWKSGMAICLTGGIAPQYASYLPHDMQSCVTAPAGEPLSGALSLAQAFSEEIANEHL
ncbi:BadF/BadG/BcrA/BcrD ATPase family protein [Aliiroseovarius sp. S253]|uniref:BadF/BadG/BcrA/BcrD ATPase family protein n=1 Tax=Aliiroseovarius sp. S253 TaxID=3415133 RepID=UPI003C7CF53C